jgi:hypothetical protein
MKTVTLIAMSLLIGMVLAITLAWSQDDMTIVDNAAFDDPQRTPSVFTHDAHNETAGIDDCAECHHVYEGGKRLEDESSEDQSCSECHDLKGSEGQPSLIKAFHANCKGCHQEKNEGPIMCGECHIK